MTTQEGLNLIKHQGVRVIDLRFVDLPGHWQHITLPAERFDESLLKEGRGFDGSSINGFQDVHESDMLLLPEGLSAFVDPFMEQKTLVILCNIVDPVTRRNYPKDPRYIAWKAEKYLRTSGVGDVSYWGPEAEFFLLNDLRFDQTINGGYYHVDSNEGSWNMGREVSPNLAYKIRPKGGYFPIPPMDSLHDMRSEMTKVLQDIGIKVEGHHHESATGGQAEISIEYDTLVSMADKMMKYKYVVKNTARRHGMLATFMPKPLYGDSGSGLHVHQSIFKGKVNTFYDEKGYAGLSETAMFYMGGLLKHASALCAIVNPTTNSYKRLTPRFEAPFNLIYSQRNRSAACRIPLYSKDPKAKRVEFRTPDPSCNPYLAFAAILMAGLDGIANKIDPGAPFDENIYDFEPKKLKKFKTVPSSLEDALDALEKDHEFLLKGDVFTEEFLEQWIEYKREKEVNALRLRPHPYEFVMYHDI